MRCGGSRSVERGPQLARLGAVALRPLALTFLGLPIPRLLHQSRIKLGIGQWRRWAAGGYPWASIREAFWVRSDRALEEAEAAS